MERDFEANPYTPDEQRVAQYIVELLDVGGGDDPIAFLLASHRLMVDQVKHLRNLVDKLEERSDGFEQALFKVESWSEAYPLEVFPEPDLVKARDLLAAGGVALDAVAAHCMRHVVEGVGKIAKEALNEAKEALTQNDRSSIDDGQTYD